MHKKYYWLVLMAAVTAVWLYTLGRSAGEMFALLAAVPAPRTATVAPTSEPLVAASRPHGNEESAVEAPAVAASEPSLAPEPSRIASQAAERAPRFHADTSYAPPAETAEPIDHPEVTDPHLRKLLRPAWDD